MLIAGIVTALLSALIVAGTFFWMQRSISNAVGGKEDEIASKIDAIQEQLKQALQYVNSYASRGQYQTLGRMLEQAASELEGEKASLKEIESKLDSAQKSVEEKESLQQDLKSAKEEDEIRLQQVMETFSQLSQECISMEQKLASSLKELDRMRAEMDLTADQKTALDELSEALTNAGSLFRDLITEYGALNDRLKMLQQQHQDLEDEYTKLVEQQLGE